MTTLELKYLIKWSQSTSLVTNVCLGLIWLLCIGLFFDCEQKVTVLEFVTLVVWSLRLDNDITFT